MLILGIETSCDETAAAVVADGREVRSSVVASQVEIHARTGGVVPEVAARCHLEAIVPVTRAALRDAQVSLADIDAVAVTYAPGLVGALLVGLQFAKGLAFARGTPLVPVHHIAGHIQAPLLAHGDAPLPALALVVSGGHTHLYEMPEAGVYRLLGRTRDDAAGEAFDKVAKLLGLGYPGGPIIDRVAAGGDDRALEFAIAKMTDGRPDFSFSGLKTAVLTHVRAAGLQPLARPPRDPAEAPREIRDLAASFQRAVVTALLRRLEQVARAQRPRSLLLTGGVAANTRLRREAAALAERLGLPLFVAPPALCTDNAAMIAAAGQVNYERGLRAGWDLNAEPHLALGV